MSIINMQGNTVYTLTPAEYPEGANAIPVDVSGLNKGIYFLKVQAGEASNG